MAHVRKRRRKGRRPDWIAEHKGDDGRRVSKSFAKKADAERYIVYIEGQKQRGLYVDPKHGKKLFGEWLDQWWKTTTDLRPGTRARDESYMKQHVKPRFEAKPIAEITQIEVRQWVADLSTKKKPGTVRLIYSILSRAMDAAVDGNLIAISPCRRIPLPKLERGEPRFLSQEQVHKIADAIDPHYRALVLTAAYLGPRWGELAGLRVERLDLLHRKLSIVSQATEVKGKITLDEPLKTPASRRTLTVPKFLKSILEEQIATEATRKSGLVFASSDGAPMRRTNFRRRQWADATDAAKLTSTRFHDLRHTSVAFAIERGAHPRAIQERMGHSSINTTLTVYGGLFPRLEEAIADGLDELYLVASK